MLKPFDQELNNIYDTMGKKVLCEILLQAGHTDIVVRVDENLTIEELGIWDIKSVDKNNCTLYWDVEVKRLWQHGDAIPSIVHEFGFSFPNRKSKTHNAKQSIVNYMAIVSEDCRGVFVVKKSVFELQDVYRKNTIYTNDEAYRNVAVKDGIYIYKNNNLWVRKRF